MQTPANPVLKRLRGRLYTISDLCTTDEKRLEIAVWRCVSGFSDPEGRWFESSRAHQTKSLEKPVVMRFSGLFVFCFSFRKSC